MKTMSSETPGLIAPNRQARYAGLAILACLLWASGFGTMKIALAHVPPVTLAATRYVLAGLLVMLFWPRNRRTLAQIRRSWRFILSVAALQTVIVNGLFTLGMNWAQGAQGAIVIGASPLIAALTAHLLMPDDRMDRAKTGLILLGLAGVVIIILDARPWGPAGKWELFGMGLLVAAMISSAVANVLVARRRRRINPLVLNGLQLLVGGLALVPIAAACEGVPHNLPAVRFFGVLFYLSVISAATFSIWFYLLRWVKVSRLNMWKFLIPVFGAVLSWILVPGESATAAMLVGMVLVAVAVLLGARQAAAGYERPVGPA